MNVGLFVQNYLRGGLDTFLIELINNWPNKNDNIILFCNTDHPGIKVIKSQVSNNKFKLVEYNLFVFWKKKLR